MHFCMVASYITSVYLVTVFIAWSVALTKSFLNKDEISASRISGFCIIVYIQMYIAEFRKGYTEKEPGF